MLILIFLTATGITSNQTERTNQPHHHTKAVAAATALAAHTGVLNQGLHTAT